MKNHAFALVFMLCVVCGSAQQTSQFSQYMLNSFGYNPAVAGFSDSWDIMAGRRSQWVGFPDAPITNFIGVHKSIAKRHYSKYWHGAGLYVEDDRAGMFAQRLMYLSYAYHQRIAGCYTLSFGLFAGARIHSYSSSLYNQNDPALSQYPPSVLNGPEFIPGFRFRSPSFFADLTIKNLYKSKLQTGKAMIGTPSRLRPHFYITAGKKFVSKNYFYSFVPSANLRYTPAAWPALDLSCMMYIKRRVGFGVTYRYNDAAVAMLQVRIAKNIVVGIAYDYILSRMRSGASSSQELMFGFSPVAVSDYEPRTNVAECPVMEF